MRIPIVSKALLASIVALIVINANAASVTLSGRTVTIVIPKGYCELGTDPVDEAMKKLAREGIGNTNQLITGFVDCRELTELHSGKRTTATNYGAILVQTPKGKLLIVNGYTRAVFIQKLSENLSSRTPDELKTVAEMHGKKFVERFQSAENLGPLGADKNGVYHGLEGTIIDEAGQSYRSICVMGITLIKELVFSINLYRIDNTSTEVKSLLARNQSAMATFVNANE